MTTEFLDNNWEPARPLQRSPGPSGPEMPKKSQKCLPGSPAPRPQKVSKKSRGQSGKSPESLRKVSGECFWSVPGIFGDFLGSRGEISIIGVVRAPVATINFTFFGRGLLIESYINSEIFTRIWREINYCNRCAHHPNY